MENFRWKEWSPGVWSTRRGTRGGGGIVDRGGAGTRTGHYYEHCSAEIWDFDLHRLMLNCTENFLSDFAQTELNLGQR